MKSTETFVIIRNYRQTLLAEKTQKKKKVEVKQPELNQ